METQNWESALAWEKNWWGDCRNTQEEESKQAHYAKAMSISYDLQGKNICDIGGGPVSLLLKCSNRGLACSVIDPCFYPAWTVERYNKSGIAVLQQPAEQFTIPKHCDEVWMYNVLQHVSGIEDVVNNIYESGKPFRVFEWIDIPIYQGHLHVVTKEFLERFLQVSGRIVTPEFCILGEKAWVYGENRRESS